MSWVIQWMRFAQCIINLFQNVLFTRILIDCRFSNKHKNNKKIIRKKRNSVCPIYRKKGTCAKLLKGECFRIHDRKYVALCQKWVKYWRKNTFVCFIHSNSVLCVFSFIRDICEEKDCLLSHDLSSKKISICRRYLKNNCSYEGCPYVHAKPALEAPICPQFLQGYCENGETVKLGLFINLFCLKHFLSRLVWIELSRKSKQLVFLVNVRKTYYFLRYQLYSVSYSSLITWDTCGWISEFFFYKYLLKSTILNQNFYHRFRCSLYEI